MPFSDGLWLACFWNSAGEEERIWKWRLSEKRPSMRTTMLLYFHRPIARKWCMVNEAEGGLNRGCRESTENFSSPDTGLYWLITFLRNTVTIVLRHRKQGIPANYNSWKLINQIEASCLVRWCPTLNQWNSSPSRKILTSRTLHHETNGDTIPRWIIIVI